MKLDYADAVRLTRLDTGLWYEISDYQRYRVVDKFYIHDVQSSYLVIDEYGEKGRFYVVPYDTRGYDPFPAEHAGVYFTEMERNPEAKIGYSAV